MQERIFLDYNSTTPLDPRVFKAMTPYMTELYGNPHSSEHSFGWEAEKASHEAKTHIAELINSLEDEIIFTSGATESNNAAIIGTALKALEKSKKRTIIISEIEHKCVLGSARFTEKLGFRVLKAPVLKSGLVDVEKLKSLITEDTLLISTMATNNEIGTNQPIGTIGKICKERGIVFHVDAAQGLYSEIDVVDMGIDLLSLSGHKIYGPKGVGILFIGQDLPLKPLPIIHGGGQQNGFRSGTMPTPLIVGFGEAAKIFTESKEQEREKVQQLRDHLLSLLQRHIPNLQINGALANRHPGNINITIPNIETKQLILKMQPTLAISTGSACTSGIPEPSHVLKAIGLSTKDAESSLRICLGRYTTSREIEDSVRIIVSTLEKTN